MAVCTGIDAGLQVWGRCDGKRLGREASTAQTSGECGAKVDHELSSRAVATAARGWFAQSTVNEYVDRSTSTLTARR